jgi:hypothetical protein
MLDNPAKNTRNIANYFRLKQLSLIELIKTYCSVNAKIEWEKYTAQESPTNCEKDIMDTIEILAYVTNQLKTTATQMKLFHHISCEMLKQKAHDYAKRILLQSSFWLYKIEDNRIYSKWERCSLNEYFPPPESTRILSTPRQTPEEYIKENSIKVHRHFHDYLRKKQSSLPLQKGNEVLIDGLPYAKHLNGLKGILGEWDPVKGWRVTELSGSTLPAYNIEAVWIKPRNLSSVKVRWNHEAIATKFGPKRARALQKSKKSKKHVTWNHDATYKPVPLKGKPRSILKKNKTKATRQPKILARQMVKKVLWLIPIAPRLTKIYQQSSL